jgi:hypothetical protein
MIDNFKIIKKILMSETFNVDGFEYQFISVEPYQDWGTNIVVNVVLPKKGQSFVVEKFSEDISHIIERFSTYLGSVISYNEKILVDGRPVPKMGVYINKEDQNEIINALNGNMSNFLINNGNVYKDKIVDLIKIKGSLKWKKAKKFYDHYESIDFYFYYDVSNVIVNDGKLNINPGEIDKFATVLNDMLQDNHNFRDEILDNIYMVLDHTTKIEHLDANVYYNAHYYLDRINGKKSELKYNNLGFDSSMFVD